MTRHQGYFEAVRDAKRTVSQWGVVLSVAFFAVSCSDESYPEIELLSEAFEHGGTIPRRYTCDGEGLSPPLAFDALPLDTESIAVIAEGPDPLLPEFTHWLIWGISRRLPTVFQGLDPVENPAPNLVHGTNSAEGLGYAPFCPPEDQAYKFLFKGYALDKMLELAPGATVDILLEEMDDHIVGYGELGCRYER